MKSWVIGKDSDAGRDWGQEEKGTTEDEMAGWHGWLDGHESEWTPGVGDGQGGLACCDSWGHKESDMTEQLNWTEMSGNELPQPLFMWECFNYSLIFKRIVLVIMIFLINRFFLILYFNYIIPLFLDLEVSAEKSR